jgi:hypothetical protein
VRLLNEAAHLLHLQQQQQCISSNASEDLSLCRKDTQLLGTSAKAAGHSAGRQHCCTSCMPHGTGVLVLLGLHCPLLCLAL